jgi:arsenite methyltransferase
MNAEQRDQWAEWLLQRRHGGDAKQLRDVLDFLYPIRDKVLNHAALQEHEVLLDVGSGDGLIAFGALEKVPSCNVILSDVSRDLLDHTKALAQLMGVQQRCQFVQASADDLATIPDASVDVVTTRSVLIYVAAKQQAFNQFWRVLKPGGRLSIFEPINRFSHISSDDRFIGFDIAPIKEIAIKLKAVYSGLQPVETDPMLNFDERDFLLWAECAGFSAIHLQLEASIARPAHGAPLVATNWEQFIQTAWNPKIPTLQEAMQQVLTPIEQSAFTSYLRPLVEANQCSTRSAVAYLWATK